MKAHIIGIYGNESHEASIRDAFVIGWNESVTAYGSGSNITTTHVSIYSSNNLDIQAGFDYCKANNIPLLICSYKNVTSYVNVAQANHPDVTLFMPAGANTPGEIVHLDIPQVVSITGAGDLANETADNVEFISHDPIENDEQDYSSFSNGYIAGQIAYIADTLNCTIWEARYRAMQTGSENGTWHETNGFGFINVQGAINYTKYFPKTDPFITTESLEQQITTLTNQVNLQTTEIINLNTQIILKDSRIAQLEKLLKQTPQPTTATDSLKISNIINDFSKNHHNIDFNIKNKQYDFSTP